MILYITAAVFEIFILLSVLFHYRVWNLVTNGNEASGKVIKTKTTVVKTRDFTVPKNENYIRENKKQELIVQYTDQNGKLQEGKTMMYAEGENIPAAGDTVNVRYFANRPDKIMVTEIYRPGYFRKVLLFAILLSILMWVGAYCAEELFHPTHGVRGG